MHTAHALLFIIAITTSAHAADGPRVIQATPDNNAQDVDPTTCELRIVFDRAMSHASHSVVGGGPAFPKIGTPRWLDERTFIVPVELEPEHEYRLSVNNARFTAFRDVDGRPATPYPISFTTGPDASAPPITPERNRESIEQLRRAIDESYSYRDRKGLDWKKIFAEAKPKMELARTRRQFAESTGRMLASAEDIHITLRAGQIILPSFRREVDANMNWATLARTVPQWRQHNAVVFAGRFDDGVGYINIASWPGDDPRALERAFDMLAKSEGKLVIDVRANSGGSEPLARELAGCFIDERVVYARSELRREGKFTGPVDRAMEPNKNCPIFRGRLAVLMGPVCMSSCESFLMMMKRVPGCKLVGQRSYGSSGNPQPIELANGVTVLLPSWRDLDLAGECIEGVGIAPDIGVRADANDFAKADPVLEAALKWVRER